MKKICFESNSLEDTKHLAKQVASSLSFPTIIALYGNIGSGKTTFCHFLGKFLGIKENLTSPTYNIFFEYPLKNNKVLYHFDLYRVDKKNIESLYLEEYLNNENALCFIEWAEKIDRLLLKVENVKKISFTNLTKNKRKIQIY